MRRRGRNVLLKDRRGSRPCKRPKARFEVIQDHHHRQDAATLFVAASDILMPEDLFTNGFGTILAAEHDLLATVQDLAVTKETGPPSPVLRILRHHTKQLETIIDLLELREGLLPFPNRFMDGGATVPQTTHVRPVATESWMSDLVQRHQALRESLGRLIEVTAHEHDGESGLREAAQRHEEMEWMLMALLNEKPPDAGRLV